MKWALKSPQENSHQGIGLPNPLNASANLSHKQEHSLNCPAYPTYSMWCLIINNEENFENFNENQSARNPQTKTVSAEHPPAPNLQERARNKYLRIQDSNQLGFALLIPHLFKQAELVLPSLGDVSLEPMAREALPEAMDSGKVWH